MAKNPLDPKVIEEARKRVKTAFPHEGLRLGFFTNDPQGASVFGGIAKVAKTVLMNIVGESVTLRFYREPKPEEKQADIKYKVYEYTDINTENAKYQTGSKVVGHHIKHDVAEDITFQNNMSVEVAPDGKGGLQPNVQPDGMVKVHVNFPDPTEEMIKKALERAKSRLEPPKEPEVVPQPVSEKTQEKDTPPTIL